MISQPYDSAEHEADYRQTEEGEGGSGEVFEILGEAATPAKPGERPLDDQALGDHLEALGGVSKRLTISRHQAPSARTVVAVAAPR